VKTARKVTPTEANEILKEAQAIQNTDEVVCVLGYLLGPTGSTTKIRQDAGRPKRTHGGRI